MKVIFDSEEQKDRFSRLIPAYFCPSDFSLPDLGCDEEMACAYCWGQVVETEVKETTNE